MTTLLLVDDSRVMRELMKVYLVTEGMTLLEAADGDEALSVVRAKKPDLVIADMNMPKLDGPSLCRQLAADPTFARTPVVILTGSKDPAAKDNCLAAGAREVLIKPVKPPELLGAVKRHLPK